MAKIHYPLSDVETYPSLALEIIAIVCHGYQV